MELNEQYNELNKSKKRFTNEATDLYRKLVVDHFPDVDLTRNVTKKLDMYVSKVREARGANSTYWPIEDRSEIYIDGEFILENLDGYEIAIVHEMLHMLQAKTNEYGHEYTFGHLDSGEMDGINEATTQMYAEDITGVRLEDDYLSFVTNIMRVLNIVVGKESLASQYFNNSTDFELDLNSLTANRFNWFKRTLNNLQFIYLLQSDDPEAIRLEEEIEMELLDFVSDLVNRNKDYDPDLIPEIESAIKDKEFLKQLNTKTRKRKK